jgi:hypothetical protein
MARNAPKRARLVSLVIRTVLLLVLSLLQNASGVVVENGSATLDSVIRGVDQGPRMRVTWDGQTDKITSEWDKTKAMTVGKVTNMRHNEGNEGDQFKSYKEVIKEGNDRSYALLPNMGHGGNRGHG